jgi:thioredoxin reductase (NADPH)
MIVHDVAVIGAGPAGFAAAIQLQRSGISPVVFEKGEAGGLLRNAGCVENYPGFPDGISGENLVRLIREQAERLGVVVQTALVTDLDFRANRFHLEAGEKKWSFRRVIVATGTKPKTFGFKIPEALGKRVGYDIVPLLHKSGKRIVIVGAGEAAFDYALTLGKKNFVHVLNRGSRIKCLPLLRDRVRQQPRIVVVSNTSVLGVSEAGGRLLIMCLGPDGPAEFLADHLVGAIGRTPDLDFLAPGLNPVIPGLIKNGRLHFAGDVKNGMFRQTAIAAADGLAAAMDICRRMRKERA